MLAALANATPANNVAGGILTLVVPVGFLAIVLVAGWLMNRRGAR